jgi:hypothetical protein
MRILRACFEIREADQDLELHLLEIKFDDLGEEQRELTIASPTGFSSAYHIVNGQFWKAPPRVGTNQRRRQIDME